MSGTPSVTQNPTYGPTNHPTPTPIANLGDNAGLLDVMQKYVMKSALVNDGNGDYVNVGHQLDDINSNLNGISSALGNNSSTLILSQQAGVSTIVNTELQRLNDKKQSIDTALTTQKRMMMMNDSILKRQRVYTRIMTEIAIALVILIFCKFLANSWNDDENTNVIISIVCILVIVIVVIHCGWLYVDLLRRDPIYYDQLHYIPDNVAPANTTVQANTQQQLLSGAPGTSVDSSYGCVGNSCCSHVGGTVWDASMNICVKESFVNSPYTKAPMVNRVKKSSSEHAVAYEESDGYQRVNVMM